MTNNFFHFFTNQWFWSAFAGWMTAQAIKLVADLIKTGRVDWTYFFSTGGMPSAHSALVSGLATAIGWTEGYGSPMMALAASFASITMFDAAGVRNAAGRQARILNKITDEIFRERKFSEGRLKELLGHTRSEVFAGMAVGICVAIIICSLWH